MQAIETEHKMWTDQPDDSGEAFSLFKFKVTKTAVFMILR